MAQQKITLIAELKDKLSGSLQSIEKNVESTTRAVDDHAKHADKAYAKAADAAKKSAQDTKTASNKAEKALASVGLSADGMARDMQSATNKADRALATLAGDAQGSADKIDRALAAAGERGGDQMVANLRSAGSRMSTQGTKIGKETGNNIAAGIKAELGNIDLGALAVGGGAALGTVGGIGGSMAADRSSRALAAANNLSEDDLRELADPVRKDGLGESREAVYAASANIVATLDVEPGSDVAERLLRGNLTMTEVFGLDSAQLAMAVNIGVEGWNADPEEMQDVVGQMLQDTAPDSKEETLEAWREYAPLVAGTGMDPETFAAMLASAGDLGPMQVDKTGDAIKEWSIRAMDTGNKATNDAYATAGLDQNDVAARILEGDPTVFADVNEALAGIEDPVERAAASIAIIGTPIEDMGVAEIEDLTGKWATLDATVQNADGTVQGMEDTFQSGTGAEWNQAMTALEDSFVKVGDAVAPLVSKLAGFISFIAPAVGIIAPFVAVLGGIGMAGRVGAGLAGALGAVGIGGGAAAAGTGLLAGGLGLLKAVLMKHPIMLLAGIVWAGVEAFGYLYENSELVRGVVDGIAGAFGTIDDEIRSIGEGIEGLIRDKFPQLNGAMDTIETNFNAIGGGAAREAVDNTAIGGNPLFTMLGEKTGVNDWLRDNHVMGPKKETAEGGFTATGDHFAEGGWTTGNGYYAGERGREFITSAWASNKVESNHPGALATINATGELPPAPAGDSIYVDARGAAPGVGAEVEAAVTRALAKQGRKATRQYMTPSAKGAN